MRAAASAKRPARRRGPKGRRAAPRRGAPKGTGAGTGGLRAGICLAGGERGSAVAPRPGKQEAMTAGMERCPGGVARTRSPEAGVEGRRHLRGGAPHCRGPDCGGSAKLPALTGPRPGGRCPSWRRPLRRSPFRSMARPVTARRLRTGEAATPAPAAAQKQARARPAPSARPAPGAPPHGGARLRGEREAYHLLPPGKGAP